MCERWRICKFSKNWWTLTFFMSEVAGDTTMKAATAAVSSHLCNNPPCRPCPVISVVAKQNCRGENGSISLKNQRIWSNQAVCLLQNMWRWGRWRRSWCCNYIFRVRGDEAAWVTEIVIVRNCGWLCRVRYGRDGMYHTYYFLASPSDQVWSLVWHGFLTQNEFICHFVFCGQMDIYLT
jgi:hypothetical protein